MEVDVVHRVNDAWAGDAQVGVFFNAMAELAAVAAAEGEDVAGEAESVMELLGVCDVVLAAVLPDGERIAL